MNAARNNKKGIVVFSGGITYKGNLPYFVKYRLDEAYRIYQAGHVDKIILCGKWSYHLTENPPRTEAVAMSEYIEKLGVPKKDILLEEKSIDLISSVINLKEIIESKNKFTHLVIIGSDFQEERLSYIFKKIFANKCSYIIRLIPSRLPPELLWKFFLYESETLTKTKIFLRSKKITREYYNDGQYLKSAFYKKSVSHYLPQLVYSNKLGRSSQTKAHYSLATIYKKRVEIFQKYNLELNKNRTLKADFWSGRFLNFLGRDINKSYYCLKFALKPKDKQSFINEINISKLLNEKGVSFTPIIVDKHIQNAPVWYLYKVVGGRIAGEFSRTFCFDEYFYQSFTPKLIASHLKSLQSILTEKDYLPVWDGKMYLSKTDSMFKRFQSRHISEKELNRITQASKLIKKSSNLLNSSILYLSHNDLHPANIIISTSKKMVYLLDFEHIGLNNIAFDFCFVYLFSWNNPSFQKKLLKQYISILSTNQQKEFISIFPYVYSYFLLWLLEFTYMWKYRTDKKYVKDARSYIVSELDTIIMLNIKNQLDYYLNKYL